jgi:uncharacterized membrane protein YidH (DUF202 family)
MYLLSFLLLACVLALVVGCARFYLLLKIAALDHQIPSHKLPNKKPFSIALMVMAL